MNGHGRLGMTRFPGSPEGLRGTLGVAELDIFHGQSWTSSGWDAEQHCTALGAFFSPGLPALGPTLPGARTPGSWATALCKPPVLILTRPTLSSPPHALSRRLQACSPFPTIYLTPWGLLERGSL